MMTKNKNTSNGLARATGRRGMIKAKILIRYYDREKGNQYCLPGNIPLIVGDLSGAGFKRFLVAVGELAEKHGILDKWSIENRPRS